MLKQSLLVLGLLGAIVGLAQTPPEKAPTAGLREIFPGVRVDPQAKVVEFDGIVPVNAHTKAGLKVFLETTVCTFDTKEHESLVMTKAKPSQVHAALLLTGLKPGKPGAWKQENKAWIGVPPEGDGAEVVFLVKSPDGTVQEADPTEWIINIKDGRSLKQTSPDAGWVFAGSKLLPKKPSAAAPGEAVQTPAKQDAPKSGDAKDPAAREPAYYAADFEGTLVGLASFGNETIGWSAMYNPDSDKQAPEWVASAERTPVVGTPITVRIRPKADKKPDPPSTRP
ncbi:MAG: YdjY domain-containing protein [Phycisphaerales bacterium]